MPALHTRASLREDGTVVQFNTNTIFESNNYISFKADGVLKTGSDCEVIYFKSKTIDFSRVTLLSRTNTNERMSLDVVNPVVGQPSMLSALYAVPMGVDTTKYFTNGSGEITIKSLTTDRVTGTFKFNGITYLAPNQNSKNITEGSFGCKVTLKN